MWPVERAGLRKRFPRSRGRAASQSGSRAFHAPHNASASSLMIANAVASPASTATAIGHAERLGDLVSRLIRRPRVLSPPHA